MHANSIGSTDDPILLPEHCRQWIPDELTGLPAPQGKNIGVTPARFLTPFADKLASDKPVSRAEYMRLRSILAQLLKQRSAKGGR